MSRATTAAVNAPGTDHSHRAAPEALLVGASSLALLASGLAGGVFLDRRFRPAFAPSFRRLTFRRGVVRSARFAPDGKTILYGALWDGDRCRAHSVRIDSPESRPLDLPEANVLAVSRSGEVALALGSHFDGIVTYGTLARVPIAGGAPRQILEDVKFADWSPDGCGAGDCAPRGRPWDRLEFPMGRPGAARPLGENTRSRFARCRRRRRGAFVPLPVPVRLVAQSRSSTKRHVPALRRST